MTLKDLKWLKFLCTIVFSHCWYATRKWFKSMIWYFSILPQLNLYYKAKVCPWVLTSYRQQQYLTHNFRFFYLKFLNIADFQILYLHIEKKYSFRCNLVERCFSVYWYFILIKVISQHIFFHQYLSHSKYLNIQIIYIQIINSFAL